MSFNIKRGAESSLTEITDAIRGLQPDICLIQEIDRRVARSRSIDQHRLIARRCGFQENYFFTTKTFGPLGSYGHGLYFKDVQHTQPTVITLPTTASAERRVAHLTTIQSGDQRFLLAGTHLSANHEQAERQLSFLLEKLDEHSAKTPRFVLAGDLNLPPRVIERFGFTLDDATLSCGLPQRTERYDYALARGLNLTTRVVALPGLSDHDPIIATLA